jgi:hypothetical protein
LKSLEAELEATQARLAGLRRKCRPAGLQDSRREPVKEFAAC